MNPIQNRHEFVLLFDVTDGNPNGDPDAGNMPRQDPETSQGLVTDICIKRKVRDYVELTRNGHPGHEIYIREHAVLNQQHGRGWKAAGLDPEKQKDTKRLPKDDAKAREITQWMCSNFFDIRTFGAVMTTGINSGQVRGPVQLKIARSIEPILPAELSITRIAATNESESGSKSDNRTMGRKHIVPYGLYRMHGYISAPLADTARGGTGFSEADLDLLWEALTNMFENDRSAARGEMVVRGLVVFRHDSPYGNAMAHEIFERVTVKRIFEDEEYEPGDPRTHSLPPARSFSDYRVHLDWDSPPQGVTMIRKI